MRKRSGEVPWPAQGHSAGSQQSQEYIIRLWRPVQFSLHYNSFTLSHASVMTVAPWYPVGMRPRAPCGDQNLLILKSRIQNGVNRGPLHPWVPNCGCCFQYAVDRIRRCETWRHEVLTVCILRNGMYFKEYFIPLKSEACSSEKTWKIQKSIKERKEGEENPQIVYNLIYKR